MLTRNKRAARAPQLRRPHPLPSKPLKKRYKWSHELTLSLLDTLSKPEHRDAFTSNGLQFSRDMAIRYFNNVDRAMMVNSKIVGLRHRYFKVKAQQLVRRTPIRFRYYHECQRAFEPHLIPLVLRIPTTSDQQQRNRPMVVPNGDLQNDDDDDTISLSSLDNGSVLSSPVDPSDYHSQDDPSHHHSAAEYPHHHHHRHSRDYRSPATPPTREPSNRERELREKEIQLQLQMMKHERSMAKMRIKELELMLEITKEQGKLPPPATTSHPSYHTTAMHSSFATAMHPSYC